MTLVGLQIASIITGVVLVLLFLFAWMFAVQPHQHSENVTFYGGDDGGD